jgi:hypothetical protein
MSRAARQSLKSQASTLCISNYDLCLTPEMDLDNFHRGTAMSAELLRELGALRRAFRKYLQNAKM